MEKLYKQIKEYTPYNRQEAADKALMLQFMEGNPDCLTRENLTGHFATSAWVVNPQRTKVLMIYHNIYKSWSWAGGHADGESDLLAVAHREILEDRRNRTDLQSPCAGLPGSRSSGCGHYDDGTAESVPHARNPGSGVEDSRRPQRSLSADGRF